MKNKPSWGAYDYDEQILNGWPDKKNIYSKADFDNFERSSKLFCMVWAIFGLQIGFLLGLICSSV